MIAADKLKPYTLLSTLTGLMAATACLGAWIFNLYGGLAQGLRD